MLLVVIIVLRFISSYSINDTVYIPIPRLNENVHLPCVYNEEDADPDQLTVTWALIVNQSYPLLRIIRGNKIIDVVSGIKDISISTDLFRGNVSLHIRLEDYRSLSGRFTCDVYIRDSAFLERTTVYGN